jgi:phosphopantetheinyl transferase (holo-ACP synthase)
MLGNDIVDLADPEACESALHPRFDARVFAAPERVLLAGAADRGALRWALWAAKEAAYKAARQLDPALHFHPRAFVVQRDVVRHATRCFRLRVTRSGELIHAVAEPADLPPRSALARSCVVPPGTSPGAAARALARRVGALLLGVDRSELEIASSGRLPRLLLRGADCGVELSLSHHGRFAGCALAPALPETP